jgi:hypothetical protein
MQLYSARSALTPAFAVQNRVHQHMPMAMLLKALDTGYSWLCK